jgi:serine/threonine-protein phosphatase 2B catalytic subunit
LVRATLYDSLISGLGSKKIPDVALLRKHLLVEGTVTKECLMHLLKEVTAVFRKWYLNQPLFFYAKCVDAEPNLVKIKEPCVIIGDIHGQYYDMIHMFEKVIDPRGLPG